MSTSPYPDRTIVAFLQNQWFKDPTRARALLARYEAAKSDGREAFIGDMLFFGCLTGQRLRRAFGEPLCERIVWENVSREIGGRASSSFPSDRIHICTVLAKHRPDVVLAFGRVAQGGVEVPARKLGYLVIQGPHPAARGPGVLQELARMRSELELFLGGSSPAASTG